MRNILVTGGGGFLGFAIIKQLINPQNNISSFSRSSHSQLSKLDIKQIQGNLADKNGVFNAVKGNDVVFHVAAKPGIWGDYQDYFQTNYIGTKNIVDACIQHKIPHLIYTSSPSVIFNGTDMEGVNESMPYPLKYHAHYPETKAMAEKYVISAGKKNLKTICLRPHLIWGPGDNHLVPRILSKAKKLVRVGKKENLVDTVYIDNAAHAHILALESLKKNSNLSGKTYFISQDEPILLWDMVNAILDAGKLPPVTRTLPYSLVKTIGYFTEIIYKTLNISTEPPITRFMAEEVATSHWFDISAAKQDLGYRPLVSTKEGLLQLKKFLQSPTNKNQ